MCCTGRVCEVIERIKKLEALLSDFSDLLLESTNDQSSGDSSSPEQSSGSVRRPSSEEGTTTPEDSNSTVEQADKKLVEISQTVTDLIILEKEENVDRERIRRISHQMADLSKSLEELASGTAEISDDNHKLISDKIYTTLSQLFNC